MSLAPWRSPRRPFEFWVRQPSGALAVRGAGRGGEPCATRAPPRGAAPGVCDDADVVRRWALAGKGLVYKSWL
ncbi:hypothetical protein I5F83_28100, partial [Pseudomonas aeruginosa]|nr:hypothetical protein [Pseudomonas aeruginosa]